MNFNLFSRTTQPDIIVLTETWLQSDTFDQGLGLIIYNIYRCDRDLVSTELSRGGGTLVAAKSHLKSTLIHTDAIGEQVLVTVKADDFSFLICDSYFAPDCDISVFTILIFYILLPIN